MPPVDVVRTYLEITDHGSLTAVDAPGLTYSLRREAPCSVATYRDLYDRVGRDYQWRDRGRWSDVELSRYLARERVTVWVLRDGDESAGFFELVTQDDGSTEIAYFGLLGEFHGRGLGKYLLTRAVEEAWRQGATRVWLHTCTLDGPAALPNYLARGFKPFKTESYSVELPVEESPARVDRP